ncbi:MAG: hypothetical protein AAFN93_26820 [Bacteroidota bacterium]
MIERIEDSDSSLVRSNRPTLSEKFHTHSLLKTLVFNRVSFSSTSLDETVKGYIVDNIEQYSPLKTIYKITDHGFKASLLCEANLQFNKALYNWSIYKQLVSKGLWTWAFVTLYYSQFYTVCGLLNIQGNAFSRPLLKKDSSEDKQQALFHVYTEDFSNGVFFFERRSYKPHEDLWKQ